LSFWQDQLRSTNCGPHQKRCYLEQAFWYQSQFLTENTSSAAVTKVKSKSVIIVSDLLLTLVTAAEEVFSVKIDFDTKKLVLGNSVFDSHARENSGQAVHLPGHSQTSSSVILFRPVCLQADKLNHCSHHHYSSHIVQWQDP